MTKKILLRFSLLLRYIFKDTRYFFWYIWRYFQNNYHNNAKFYADEEFANLIKAGKSIIRIGDGEIGLTHFFPIRYQIYSDAIKNDLLKIIKNYTNDSKYVLMIPLFVNYTNTQLKKINRFLAFRQIKTTYELIFNNNATYFDQLIFYKKGGSEKFIVPHLKNKKVIIVTNKEHTEKIQNSPLASSDYSYIACNNENTYESRLAIQNEIIKLITDTGLPKEEFVVLFSTGLAKTIIYDMAEWGYQVLDIGKGLESYYTNTDIEHTI